jgi:hypothetical protein
MSRIKPLKQCPRCYEYLNNITDLEECPCGFSVYYSQVETILSVTNIIVKNDELVWYSKSFSCVYIFSGNKKTKLPWLSFDIAKDKLKLILLLS